MAAAGIVRSIVALIKRYGLSRGVKKARKLGFKSTNIKQASTAYTKLEKAAAAKNPLAGIKLKKGHAHSGPPDYKVYRISSAKNAAKKGKSLSEYLADAERKRRKG